MDISSAKIDQNIISEKQSEFLSAKSKFSNVENIFSRVNSDYLSSELNFQIKNFEKNLVETAYENLQDELSRLRFKERAINNTTLVSTSNIVKHEARLKQDPVIIEVESKIAENQSQILDYQQKLGILKVSPSIINYELLSKKIESLSNKESSLVELIAKKAADGEDITSLEIQLEQVRKEIEQKEKERAELQPEYDEMKELEAELETLLKENAELVQKRFDLDPEYVKFSKLYTFFDQIIQGNGNGLGVESDLSKYRNDLSETEEEYEDKSEQSGTFQELLNKNLSIKNAVKADLETSKMLREQKELTFLQTSTLA